MNVRLRADLLCAVALLLAFGCGERTRPRRAAAVRLPDDDDVFISLAPGATVAELLRAVDQGLRTRSKGPDFTRFIVIRAGDRHGPEVKDDEFHVVVGAGVRMPSGSLRIRREWIASGRIDGDNQQLQTMGVAVVVERGAPRPFPPEVVRAVGDFCEALTARVPIHPDCVVAMGEVPYTRSHPADAAERALAAAARKRVPVPPIGGTATITTASGKIPIAYEKRQTSNARAVGMMMRKRFDGENRGMLFVYPWRDYHHFWMKNCFIPIDVAYIREGKIDQIVTMKPAAGTRMNEIRYYDSRSAVKSVLEMPGGWFATQGVRKGDSIRFQ